MTSGFPSHLIKILAPEVCADTVTFRWSVEPPTSLYRNLHFTMKFPAELDLEHVPHGLWWRIALICLHSQWPLLRPCRVELPIRLLPGEKELWLRLIATQVSTLEAYRKTPGFDGAIEIVDEGPMSYLHEPGIDAGRCATAFSGGKDSLLQTGILCEFTEHPVLVSTTSPMPSLEDHQSARRRQILNDISKRRPVYLVEVESDYRANFDHAFAELCGYPVSVNEITDAFLYLSSLVAAAASLKIGHVFLASEFEVQENAEIEGRTVQHPHYMYSVVTQSALSGVLAHWGIECSSLTAALHSYQVQELLSTRYSDLRDLQYSCWRVRADEMACNACSQCLRVAFSLLSLGDRPSLIGMKLGRILRKMRKWVPLSVASSATPALPAQAVSARLHAQVMRSILTVPEAAVLKEIGLTPSKRLPIVSGFVARASYRRLRNIAQKCAPGPAPGFCPGFLEFIDPLLRSRVSEVYAHHFVPQGEPDYTGLLSRCRALSDWILAPLKSAVNETEKGTSRA